MTLEEWIAEQIYNEQVKKNLENIDSEHEFSNTVNFNIPEKKDV